MSLRSPFRLPEAVTPATLIEWLDKAAPGDALEYYSGEIGHDRTLETSDLRRAVQKAIELAPHLHHFMRRYEPGEGRAGWSYMVAVLPKPAADRIKALPKAPPRKSNVIHLNPARAALDAERGKIE